LEGYCALYSWLWALPWALGVAPQSVVMMMMIFGRCVLMMMMIFDGVADEQSGTHPYTSDRERTCGIPCASNCNPTRTSARRLGGGTTSTSWLDPQASRASAIQLPRT